jgi:hypothetical protein
VTQPGIAFGGGTQGYLTRLPSLAIGPSVLGPMAIGYRKPSSVPAWLQAWARM